MTNVLLARKQALEEACRSYSAD